VFRVGTWARRALDSSRPSTAIADAVLGSSDPQLTIRLPALSPSGLSQGKSQRWCDPDPLQSGSSIYHSMQLSWTDGSKTAFSAGAHYTWSAFIDTASEPFNPSSAEKWPSLRIPSTRAWRCPLYLRPAAPIVGQCGLRLRFIAVRRGLSRFLGGWQLGGFLTLRAAPPFGVLNGSDPTEHLAVSLGRSGIQFDQPQPPAFPSPA